MDERLPLASSLDAPTPRILLVWDNLTGHYTVNLILWLFDRGIMLLCTRLGGSHLTTAESIQRILKRRALDGQHPRPGKRSSTGWRQQRTAGTKRRHRSSGGGKRQVRRQRARARRHAVGG